MKKSLSDVFTDYLRLLKEKLEESLQKNIVCFFLVVPEVTPFLQAFFNPIATALSISIELISSTTSMCLSYGFFDKDVKKQVLLLDFGWEGVRVQTVMNENNEYKLGAHAEIPALSGRALYDELANTVEMQIVGWKWYWFIFSFIEENDDGQW